MIDIGVNLLHSQFARDRDQVLDRARQAGVSDLLITATDITSSREAIDFAQIHSLYCTAGVHPHDASSVPEKFTDTLLELAAAEVVKAIGETGLDFNRNFSPPDIQRRVFDIQLNIAAALQKPVFVHDRDSDGAVFDLLSAHADHLNGVVVHCFTGTRGDLHKYLDAGFYIGITGWVSDPKRGGGLRALVPEIPLDRLLLETDAPFLLPHGITDWPPPGVPARYKRRNEPMLLPVIAGWIAELYDLPVGRIIEASTDNARQLFQLAEPG